MMALTSSQFPVCLVTVSNSKSPSSSVQDLQNSLVKCGQNKNSSWKKTGSLKDFSSDIGCSALIIDHQQGLVLTTAVPFADFIPDAQDGEVGHQSYSTGTNCYRGDTFKELSVHVIIEDQQIDVSKNRNCERVLKMDSKLQQLVTSSKQTRNGNWTVSSLTDLGDCASESNDVSLDCPFLVLEAKVLLLWQCQALDDVMQRLLPSGDGWVLDYGEKSEEIGARAHLVEDQSRKHVEPIGVSGARRENNAQDLVTWFALLKVDGGIQKPASQLSIMPSCRLFSGQRVTACGTPFAVLCPSIFTNSISDGVITKVAGEKGALVMTDARCMPGMEGGGIFVEDNISSTLAALIVSPLCWKANEWIGLTLACSLEAILDSLHHVTLTHPCHGPVSSSDLGVLDEVTEQPALISGATPRHLENSFRSVVLIRVGPVWGSGVIVSAQEGLVLTCQHVVKGANIRGVQIRVDSQHWIKASLLFVTSDTSPLDLAVLTVETSPVEGLLSLVDVQMSPNCNQGSRVFVIGYPLLDPSTSSSPLVTSGIVSKVIQFKHIPVMLQSTCAVHAGASGGALLCASTGRLLGIVASNSRDADSGASFPHVNFSIPVACFKPVLDQYISTKDLSCFKSLENQHQTVTSIWELEEKGMYRRRQAAKSKL